MSIVDLQKFRKCQTKLRMIAEDDNQTKLLASGAPRFDIRYLDTEAYNRVYGMPDRYLSGVNFAMRTLIEGLIAHGILRPGDTPPLLDELRKHAVADNFKCRILESLYNEERIKNVRKIIPGWSTLHLS